MSRQKRARAVAQLQDTDTASEQDVNLDNAPPPKRKKMSVAQNAAAIEELGTRVSGVDKKLTLQSTQLTSIAGLLETLTQQSGHQSQSSRT